MSYSSDYNLIGQAFAEATAKKYDEELLRCKRNVSFSPRHARRIREITGCRVVSPITKKRLLIILIAAVIFLVGCTSIIYREEISDFFVTHFKDHNAVEILGEEKTKITEEFDLLYIPEGYSLVYEQRDEFKIQKRWADDIGNTLTFMQTINGNGKYGFDSERSNSIIKEYNEKTLYSSISEETEIFIWRHEGYAFYLSIPSSISKSEMYKIIDSIKQY